MLWFPVQTTLIFVPGQAEILTASPYVRVIVPDVESDDDEDVYVLEPDVDEPDVDELDVDELDVDELDVDELDELDDDELDESW